MVKFNISLPQTSPERTRGKSGAKSPRPKLPKSAAKSPAATLKSSPKSAKVKSEESSGKGSRNLAILGCVSILVAVVTTSISLIIYHNSGDIYLDRSRPGFLPDEQEVEDEENKTESYVFDKNGEMTMEALEQYLSEFEKIVQDIDNYKDPFSEETLSDEWLGI